MLKKLDKKVVTLSSEDLNFEVNSFFRKSFNFFFIPLLNILPVNSRGLIKKSNDSLKEVVDNATTHKALEILYSHGHKHKIKKVYQKLAHSIWFNTNNSKAVRNRLKVVKNELKKMLQIHSMNKKEFNIVSIAAGSARAVIEAIEEIKPGVKVTIYFVDKSEEALNYSRDLIKDFSISKDSNYSFNFINDTVNGFLDKNTLKFSIVEMVGLMDYFDDERALKIFEKIYKSLKDGGHFITANINNNSERPFVTKAVGWPMIYRSAEHIGGLVHQAGFPHEEVRLYYEPHKIHSIIIASR